MHRVRPCASPGTFVEGQAESIPLTVKVSTVLIPLLFLSIQFRSVALVNVYSTFQFLIVPFLFILIQKSDGLLSLKQ